MPSLRRSSVLSVMALSITGSYPKVGEPEKGTAGKIQLWCRGFRLGFVLRRSATLVFDYGSALRGVQGNRNFVSVLCGVRRGAKEREIPLKELLEVLCKGGKPQSLRGAAPF